MLCKTIVIFKIKYTAEKNSHVLIQCTYTINRYTDYYFKKMNIDTDRKYFLLHTPYTSSLAELV